MKKKLLFIFALLNCMVAWSADGDTFTANTIEGVEMTFKVISEENKTCMSTGDYGAGTASISKSYEGIITVPAEANGYKVIEVGLYSFYNCTNVRMVTISEGIETIGYAFSGTQGLKTLVLPKSLKTIKSVGGMMSQWSKSKALEKIVISDLEAWCNLSVYESPLSEAHHLYLGEEEITNLVIPTSVTSIGDQFAYCTGIESISIHKDVTKISSNAFWGCSGVSTVTISEENANYNSKNDCNAIIETGTNTLLFGCKNTQIPLSVTSIINGAFYGCSSLTSITIPNSVTSIGSSAFYGCSGLTSVTIPNSVTSIGYGAFWDCSGLTSVTIGSGVTSIDFYSFNCNVLTSVTVLREQPISINQNAFSNRANATLYVPAGCKGAYEAANYWKEFKEIVEIGSPSSETETIEISSAGIRTFTSSHALDFTGISGLQAYIISGFRPSTGALVLTQVNDVPAGEGLLLRGTAGEYEIPCTTTDMYYTNLLTGVTSTTEISPTDGDQTNFILADGIHGINFYTLSETGEIEAGKAYLHLPTSVLTSSAREGRFIFDFDGDNITGIDEHEADINTEERYFDLQGRVVKKPSNGIYILNGKKIFIK